MNWDRPRVAIMPITRGRRYRRRTTTISVPAASPPATATAIGKASQYGIPVANRARTAAPKTPMAPCAKLTNRLDR